MLKLLVILAIGAIALCSAQGNTPSSGYSHPIKLSEFEKYVETKQKEIEAEFQTLDPAAKQLKRWDTAEAPYNIDKHRYHDKEDNLLTYDHTRVVLESIRGIQGSDFIAANWVDSYDKERRFIGTQCPMNTTATDFWRMIWQYNVSNIVMLASPHDVEKGKCYKYYPDEHYQYGEIRIKFQSKEEEKDVHSRNYVLEKGNDKKEVTHLHFQSWPDLGVPDKPEQLWNLIKRYRSDRLYNKDKPLVVHCVGGVGRTGTFLLTDSMIDMSKKEDHLDFYKHLWTIRNQRISMVEKPPQYYYSHQVVLQAINSGQIVQTSLVMTITTTVSLLFKKLF